MAGGEGSTDHLARRCENRHRPLASRRANTYIEICHRTRTRVRARGHSQLRGRRKFLECVGGERLKHPHRGHGDCAAIARRCALSNLIT